MVFAVLVCFLMLMVWFNKPHDLSTFTPAWAFLVSCAYHLVIIHTLTDRPGYRQLLGTI